MAEERNDDLTQEEADQLRTTVLNRLANGKRFWMPLNMRQDYWMTMYLMLDIVQQAKPLGIRRYVSNDPRTGVDAAISIMTRNDVGWKIPVEEDATKDVLLGIGKVERTLQGLGYTIDDQLSQRLEEEWWVQVVQNALLRGYIWGKTHVTTAALDYGMDAPLIAEVYDSRTVFPYTDAWGLHYVCIEKYTTYGALNSLYPQQFPADGNTDLNQPAVKIEYWSNSRDGEPGINGCLAVVGERDQYGGVALYTSPEQTQKTAKWVVHPYRHNYTPEQLPVYGVPVNGLALRHKPGYEGAIVSVAEERARLLGLKTNIWQAPNTWIAESGRSLLSSVEEHVPQYNELIATIFQHFSIGTYGTWVFQNPTGEIPKFTPGIEAKVALKPGESVQRLEIQPITPDAYRLIALLQEEKQKGTLANILQAVTPTNFSSAVLHQQITNAALNSLSPFVRGFTRFSSRMGQSIVSQLQAGGNQFKPFEIITPTKKNTYFRIEFDPKRDLDAKRKYRPVAVMKPALPDDLTVRMMVARQALDPRRPILSLMTVLEDILNIDDPAAEMDRIWEDIAQTDPVIVLEQIAQALERRGEFEMAARIRENEFKTKFIQDMQFRQMTGNFPGNTGAGASPPPEAGMNPAETAPAQPNPASPTAQEGADILGQMGETLGV